MVGVQEVVEWRSRGGGGLWGVGGGGLGGEGSFDRLAAKTLPTLHHVI